MDSFFANMGMPDWAIDAFIDSIKTLPFLFLAFLFIEFFEYYFSHKINRVLKQSNGPIIGSIAAIIPQCGFSIVASTLYTRKLITRGTLIAIYLATSDEALPILFSYPEKVGLILPIVVVKLIVAIFAGYLIDLVFKSKIDSQNSEDIEEEGCCKHNITRKTNLLIHPVNHTLNVFFFILIITLVLNFFVEENSIVSLLSIKHFKFFEPVITAFIGLIPNCAVSIAITMMLIKGTLSFSAAMAGLCSNAGLGLLVLLRKNSSLKDSVFVILLLLATSIFCGILLQN